MDPCEIYAEKYRQCVLDVARKYISHLEKDELLNMKQQFEIWKKEPDKLNVNNLYTLSGWRALYTQNLFMSRIYTMLLTFRQVLMQPHVFDIMKCIKRVVSIGCGPGPDIAAVLMLLRNNIGVSHFVKVIGIDQFIGWRQYVLSLNKVDLNGTKYSVEFWQLRVEEKTLDEVLAAEMCVMSYTDAAIHTQKFWQGLKQKFSLIVILDQKKGSLTRLLRRENFRMVEYEYKGTKRFFYWVDPRGVKESLGHISARFPTKNEAMGLRNGARGGEISLGLGSQAASSLTAAQMDEEEGEEEEEDDDDNSEQQRELAAIFDRLGNIGKMPVAQLNELDEVQKIRNELCRTADSTKDSGKLGIAVKPKQSYCFALEPQKHLSKERKNQLLKAKLRELGVNSEEEGDEDEDEEDDDDAVQESDGEEKEYEDRERNYEIVCIGDSDVDHSALDSGVGSDLNEVKPLTVDLSDQETSVAPHADEEALLPIICVSSIASPPLGNAIPTVDRLMPNYSPPIIIPPINVQPDQAFSGILPLMQPISTVTMAAPSFPLFTETLSSSESPGFCLGAQALSSNVIPKVRDSSTCEPRHRSSLKRSFESSKRPNSLVLLSSGGEEAHRPLATGRGFTSQPQKWRASCLGPVENVNQLDDVNCKRFKGHTPNHQSNPAHFNSAAEKKQSVTDLRHLLNIRRQNRLDL